MSIFDIFRKDRLVISDDSYHEITHRMTEMDKFLRDNTDKIDPSFELELEDKILDLRLLINRSIIRKD